MHSIEQQSVQRRRGVRVKLLDHLRPSFPNHRRLRHVKSSILMICFLRYAQAMSINRIAFYHLETLLWIARLGTFAAAAERLNTTQPAISARVGELENHLGTVLFRREGRTRSDGRGVGEGGGKSG